MRILITGITGFVGGHLAEALLDRAGVEVHGLSRRGIWPEEWQHLHGKAVLHPCDLCQQAEIARVLAEVRPERIFHLAGYAHVGRSFQDAWAAWDGNLTATLALYEAVVHSGAKPRIVFVGSSHVYGNPEPPDQVFDETCLLRPVSPYASSKAAADLASFQYTQAPGLDIVRARPLNHIGPRQSAQYALPHFASQIAAIEQGSRPPVVETGNLDACRDLTDVRDVVQAYLLLMDQGRRGAAYNIGSGQVVSMQEVLQRLLALSCVQVEVRRQVEAMRPADAPTIRLSAAKLRRETGWTPRYSLDQTLEDILRYWRSVTQAALSI